MRCTLPLPASRASSVPDVATRVDKAAALHITELNHHVPYTSHTSHPKILPCSRAPGRWDWDQQHHRTGAWRGLSFCRWFASNGAAGAHLGFIIAARGTFIRQRHLGDRRSEHREGYVPLAHIREEGSVSSAVSTIAALGGVGAWLRVRLLARLSHGLVMWERSSATFVNVSQLDHLSFHHLVRRQWKRLVGAYDAPPHGFNARGRQQHSSARFGAVSFREALRRDNQPRWVCTSTTPRITIPPPSGEALRNGKKPLNVMTPKSLLRFPAARSPSSTSLHQWALSTVLDDPPPPAEARRVLLCTGKVVLTTW